MIKQVNKIVNTMIKSEYELILDNLIIDLQKEIFTLFYVEKLSKKDIENKLKISNYTLSKNLEIIREKISKMPEFDCKFRCDDTTEYRLRDRCRKLGKSDDYEEFCVMAFIKKVSKSELAERFNIDEDTVRKYIKLRKRELES